ncbi:MAG: hypothetical protein J6K61_07175 [Clostridia bacterium]|nr:hypothetical protein [Clostridia bacterium]
MTIGEGICKVLYASVGIVAIGVETVADKFDGWAEKGKTVVEDGKKMVKDAIKKCKICDTEEPAVIIEEDNGENAPVENA